MNHLATSGIILRRTDYGEADRIITFLTSDFGKMHAMAKGVRKSKSKLAGGIELFSVSELHFIKGKSDIDTLVSTRLIRHFAKIVRDLDRTNIAYHILKSANKTIEVHAGSEYFPVVLESLAALDEVKIPSIVAESSFGMRMLQLQGHVPEFSIDHTGKALHAEDRFTFDYDSVAFRPDPQGPYDKNHLKVLKLLAFNSPQAVANVSGIAGYCETLAPLIRSLRQQYIPE